MLIYRTLRRHLLSSGTLIIFYSLASVEGYLRTIVADLLGIRPQSVSSNKPLAEIGIDSLLALDLAYRGVEAEEREVTILFTDIAGYTSIADGMDPKDLADLLNGAKS